MKEELLLGAITLIEKGLYWAALRLLEGLDDENARELRAICIQYIAARLTGEVVGWLSYPEKFRN